MLPPAIEPMLAESCEQAFNDDRYLYEIKWDGTRALLFKSAGTIRIQSRSGLWVQERYPEITGNAAFPDDTVLDGEIVVLSDGKPDFRKLQEREHQSQPLKIELLSQRQPACFMAFDILFHHGKAQYNIPLLKRKSLLQSVLEPNGYFVYSDFVQTAGVEMFEHIRRQNMEGIMAKRIDGLYYPGRRMPEWLKIKNWQQICLHIIGFEIGKEGIASLAMGEPEGDGFRYRGNVGSGFSLKQRVTLLEALETLPRTGAPSHSPAPTANIWVRTGLTADIKFLEITRHGRLRNPVLLRLHGEAAAG